jgi:hypothetical protein
MQLQQDRRSAARQRADQVSQVLDAMRRGATLHRCHNASRVVWTLSGTEERLAHEIIIVVLTSKHVVGCDDGLFGSEPQQTYKWVNS